MYSNGTHITMIAKGSVPSPQYTSSSDSESEILLELERKRRQLDQEISCFRAQKDKEFRDFEVELRANKRRSIPMSPSIQNTGTGRLKKDSEKPPSRTSSSSALNLLAGRGTSKQPQQNSLVKKRTNETPTATTSARSGPSVSQPVVSLDRLNITGETAVPPGRPRTPPTPTVLSKQLNRPPLGHSPSTSPPRTHNQPNITPKPSIPSPDEDKHRNTLTGLFTPTYITLIDDKSGRQDTSTSALVTPPAEEEVSTAPSSFKSNLLNEVLPASSSSFPPRVIISPGGHIHASKRAYTAPTVPTNRIPSALRTASSGAIDRKPKHVTFKLADSAIVEPSSSYEEGPSPKFDDDENSSRSGSGSQSPRRSQLHRTLSPDEEDEEAGVKPGMGMGDVIQRLNDFTIAEAAKNGEDLVLEVADNVESDDEGDDLDMPMKLTMRRAEEHEEDDSDRNLDVNYHEHEDLPKMVVEEIEEDGYFSPKAKHASSLSTFPRGNSPLSPFRDDSWAELSSSDKDRLLFETRRHSDDSDNTRAQNAKKIPSPSYDETGFSRGLRQSVDGGSGVGFFELDEELASPEAGQARPFTFDGDIDGAETADDIDDENEDDENNEEDDTPGLEITSALTGKEILAEKSTKRWSAESASKFGVGSVPIDIIRPSLSVNSSWVGTFGH